MSCQDMVNHSSTPNVATWLKTLTWPMHDASMGDRIEMLGVRPSRNQGENRCLERHRSSIPSWVIGQFEVTSFIPVISIMWFQVYYCERDMLKFTTRKSVKADFFHRDFDNFKRIRWYSFKFQWSLPMLSFESFCAVTISPHLSSITMKLWCWFQLILTTTIVWKNSICRSF